MGWIAGALFALGTLLGLVIRLPLFLAALGLATVVVLASDLVRRAGFQQIFLAEILTLVLLQFGYGLGLALRATARRLRKDQNAPARTAANRYLPGHEP